MIPAIVSTTAIATIAVPATIASHSTLLLSIPALTIVVSTTAVAPATLAIAIGMISGSSRGIYRNATVQYMGMVFHHGDLTRDQLLDIPQEFLLVEIAKGQCRTTGTGSTGSAYAMYISFRNIGELEVDDMRQFIDIDPARRYIRSYQDPRLPALEILERPLPRILRFIAMDGFCTNTGTGQALSNLVGAMLGTGEHKGRRDLAAFQHMKEQAAFIFLIDEINGLLDGVCRGRNRRHLHLGGVHQNGTGQFLYLRRHRRREEKRMPLSRQFRQDLPDIMDKTHVQHPIGFIEHEIANILEVEQFLLRKIEQATRSGDEDVYPLPQGLDLSVLRNAAKDNGVAEPGMTPISRKTFIYLDGQLTGRSKDQSTDRAWTAAMHKGFARTIDRSGRVFTH